MAPARRSRSSRWSCSSWSPRSSAPATNPDDFELPVVRRLLRVGDRPARPLRRGRRAAPALPRPKRRRALALRGPADHAARLRRRALGRLPDRRARGGLARRRRCSSPGTRSTPSTRLVPRRQLGRRAAVPRRRRARRRRAHDPRAARRLVRDAPRLRRRSRCSRCSSSARRSAASPRTTSPGGVADALSLVELPQALTDTVHWIFGDERRPAACRAGVALLVARSGSPPCSAAWLLRRTSRLVRG